jgi:ubiquinone/menaquinone biosynthesis C-methylase UbiE
MSSTTFWTEHQVGGPYATLEESQQALAQRQLRFPSLLELMPVEYPGKTILDYGCGPGHDTLLFLQHGAGHVFYFDISPLALQIVDERLEMHGLADRASPVAFTVPKVDHIHCAGVLHHAEDPLAILKDFHYFLKRDGEARIMVYDGDISDHTQSQVPITRWWTRQEFIWLCYLAGFHAEHMGSYECSAPWRKNCYAACFELR